MSRIMTMDSILHDESENMAASIEHRMLGKTAVEQQPFANVVPLAAFRAEIEAASNGMGLR